MDFKWFFILALLLFGGDSLAQAYKWVDEDGVVHYSDRPAPGAQQFELPKFDTPARTPARPSTPPRPRSSADDEAEDTEQAAGYSSLTITSPDSEQVLWNIGGVLNVSLSVTPALQPGHQVRVYFDGQQRTVRSLNFQLDEVWRGTHNLQAEIVDRNGRLLIRSQTTRFYVQQSSILTGP